MIADILALLDAASTYAAIARMEAIADSYRERPPEHVNCRCQLPRYHHD